MSKKLYVYLFDQKVGILTQEKGQLNFQYNENAKYPISLAMPIRKESYKNNDTQKFFANLLPEGNQREKIAKFYGVKENPFPLLEKIGGECAGAISLYSEELEIEETIPVEFLEQEFYKYIKNLPKKPLLSGENIRLSLAGAQVKGALLLDNWTLTSILLEKIGIHKPTQKKFSTHIVKPPIENLEDTVFNELFCMLLANQLKIIVPRVHLYYTQDIPCLFVQRYDRYYRDDTALKRLHQEDFNQISGIFPEKKYQEDGGVSIKQCSTIIKNHTTAAAQNMASFLEIIIFNYLIGNCDAHGKNFSLIHNAESIEDSNQIISFHKFKNNNIALAPFYDLLSTEIYTDLGNKMAMKLGGEYNIKNIQRIHFEKMAEELNIRPKTVFLIIDSFSKVILPLAKDLKKVLNSINISSPIFNEIINLIESKVKKLAP